jgi:hypothetical protein
MKKIEVFLFIMLGAVKLSDTDANSFIQEHIAFIQSDKCSYDKIGPRVERINMRYGFKRIKCLNK